MRARIRGNLVILLVVGVAGSLSSCSSRPGADDALITNNCDSTVLAAVLDDSEFDTGMWLYEFIELDPGESQVFTRPNFDGSRVRITAVLASDDDIVEYLDIGIGDLTTVTSEDGVVLYDVQIEGGLCPVEP